MELINRSIKVPSLRQEVKIVGLGCVHYGAAGCDEKLTQFWLDYVRDTPNTYCILGGDLVDSIYEKDKRYLDEEVAAWCYGKKWGGTLIDKQFHYALAKFKPLAEAGKILWIHAGNHEWKLKTQASRDLTLDWARELDIPYAGLSALSNLFVREEKGGHSYRVTFFTQHGGGGATSDGGVANKAVGMLNSYDVDVAMMWHVHQKMSKTKPMVSITEAGTRRVRERLAAVCGTFLDGMVEGVGGYAELKGYAPTSLGPVVIHMKHEKGARTRTDPKRACDYTRIWASESVRREED